METQLRTGTADNDINALRSGGYMPQGYHIMRRFTDSDAFFIKTDVPDGLKMFQRSPLKKGVEEILRLVMFVTKFVKDILLVLQTGEVFLEQKVLHKVRWRVI